mmetsp:Transcript_22005/g.70219  ORF Transcript_22005/g.70219 Transcript_22005/m.70219 type:complete len:379 (-) Transcript_22005:804-1940(-)
MCTPPLRLSRIPFFSSSGWAPSPIRTPAPPLAWISFRTRHGPPAPLTSTPAPSLPAMWFARSCAVAPASSRTPQPFASMVLAEKWPPPPSSTSSPCRLAFSLLPRRSGSDAAPTATPAPPCPLTTLFCSRPLPPARTRTPLPPQSATVLPTTSGSAPCAITSPSPAAPRIEFSLTNPLARSVKRMEQGPPPPLMALRRSVTVVAPDSSVSAPAMTTPSVESGTSIPSDAYAAFFLLSSDASASGSVARLSSPRTSTLHSPESEIWLFSTAPCPRAVTKTPRRDWPRIVFPSTRGAPPSRITTPSLLPSIRLFATTPRAEAPATYTAAVWPLWMRLPSTSGLPSSPIETPMPVFAYISLSLRAKRTSSDSRCVPPPPWQ